MLGPPKMTFASSRNLSKLTDLGDKSVTPLTEGSLDEQQQENQPRSRFLGDKPGNRKSLTDTDGKHNRESWMEARQRKNQTGEDEKAEGGERGGARFGRRDREPDGERRNGFGDKPDARWGPREERRQNGEKPGGWRERAAQREREWDKGGQADKVPEWADDLGSKYDDWGVLSQPRNQEQFEKWKRAQHARNKKSVEEPVDLIPDEPPPPPKEAPKPKVAAEPLKLEGFGGLGDFKRTGNSPETQLTGIGTTKGKSRFMSFLGPKDVEPRDGPPALENAPTPAAHDSAKDTAEDKEGFQRILQMLGSTGISQGGPLPEPTSPPPVRQVSDGTRSRSRFTDFFDQSVKSPERLQSPPSNTHEVLQGMGSDMLQRGPGIAADPNMFGPQIPMSRASEQPPRTQQPTQAATSPDPVIPMDGLRGQQRPLSGRMNDVFLDQPPSRGAATPDINIQHLLASQRNQRQQQGPGDEQTQFLLNLMRGGSSRPSSQQNPRQDSNFPLWLDPTNMPETHAPKPRAPHPSGVFEDHIFRTHHHDLQRQEQQQPHQMPVDMQPSQRRQSQRAGPSFFDEQSLFLQQHQQQQQQQQHQQQQRHHHRNYTEPPHQQPQLQQSMPPNRRMSGHPSAGLQMQIPPQQPLPQFPQDVFLQSPTGQQGPPPGFNPHMPRHPPGIGGNAPNIFMPPQPQPTHQAQHPQQQAQCDAPPPGFGLIGGGSSMMPQPPQHPSSQPNPPPGFYSSSSGGGGGPPGILPPGFMQMRSPAGDNVAAGRVYGGGAVFDGLGQLRR